MTFKLTIALGNEAMQSGPDLAAALRDVAYKLDHDTHPIFDGKILDANGNHVGSFAREEGAVADIWLHEDTDVHGEHRYGWNLAANDSAEITETNDARTLKEAVEDIEVAAAQFDLPFPLRVRLRIDNPAWIAEAKALGEEAGRAAGSWSVGSSTTAASAANVLQMMRDGDPQADEYLPRRPNLSGEFADDPTGTSIARSVLGEEAFNIIGESEVDAIAEAWEEGVSETFDATCERELMQAAGEES